MIQDKLTEAFISLTMGVIDSLTASKWVAKIERASIKKTKEQKVGEAI